MRFREVEYGFERELSQKEDKFANCPLAKLVKDKVIDNDKDYDRPIAFINTINNFNDFQNKSSEIFDHYFDDLF